MRVITYDHPDAHQLIEQLQQEYVARYGGVDRTPVAPAEFAPPRGLFLVGYVDDVPASCGGWRVHDEASRSAEIKRMYVVPSARGRGRARALLTELERTIADAGLDHVVLEAGPLQAEALSLYTSTGYVPIESYGFYTNGTSKCFGKRLAGASSARRSGS